MGEAWLVEPVSSYLPQSSHRSGRVFRLTGIARLVRQICLLREQGETEAAARVEVHELASAVRDLRLGEGLEAVTDAAVQALFMQEEKRVADAVLLAALLIPQLNGKISPNFGPRSGASPVLLSAEPVPAPRAVEPRAGSTAIPDLLDAMLAADGATRRQNRVRSGA